VEEEDTRKLVDPASGEMTIVVGAVSTECDVIKLVCMFCAG